MVVLMLVVIVCLIFLSSLVALQGLNKAPNRALLLSIILLGLWIFMVFGLQPVFESSVDYQYQLAYSRAVFAVAALSLISLVWFVTTLLSTRERVKEFLKKILFFIGAFTFLLCMSPYVIVDVDANLSSVMPFPRYGLLMPLYVGILLSAVAAISYTVIRGSTQGGEQHRQQIRVVGIAIAGAIVIGMITNLAIPWMTGDAQSSLYMTIPILLLMGGLSYAIVRHGLFDIKLAAVRSVAYVFSLTALAMLYYFMAYAVSVVLFSGEVAERTIASPINMVLALILAFIFQPVKLFFDRVTDRIFYRNRYDTGDFLIRLGRILTSTTELQVIVEKVSQEICRTLKADGSLFLVYRDHHDNELYGDGIEKNFTPDELAELYNTAAARRGGVIIIDQLRMSSLRDEQEIYTIFSKRDVVLALPLVSADETIGYFMLGDHRTGVYTKQDIDALEAIANELVVAVQNSRSVQAIRDLNAHLEQRIESATSELLTSNEKLRQLDAAKDEFVSMASHQLRTPLTSVKGYISMVLEGDAGDITPMQKQLLEEAFVSSERMVHLIGDFLNVSRLQTGKFVLDPSLVNLADLVEEEVEGLEATAASRSLKLRYRKPSRFPSLYLDGGKIHQVVMNFIDNALYYSTDNTTITVSLTVEGGEVVFEVRDTGIGVPKSEQAGLFTKFFRATNARRQRPDGTGIGLYLAKKVIDAHEGSMVFTSTEGEGSVFGFRLPIKKLSEPPSELAATVQSGE